MSPGPDNPGSRLTLVELQRWFLDRVVSPHHPRATDARDRERSPRNAEAHPVDQVILPSATLTADQRIGIYSRMYMQRLRRIIANEHPTIEHLLGEQGFAELVRGYLHRYPPHDYTLRILPHALPYYLQQHCKHEHAALLHDVARLERAVSDAFDTPTYGKVTSADLAAVPAEAWADVRFRVDPSFRVLAFEHDAYAFVDAYHRKTDMPEIRPTKTWAVVWRHENRVWRQPISQPIYAMLAAFARGECVTTAVERGMEVWQGDEAELESKIFRWFASWIEEGYFRAIVLPAGPDTGSISDSSPASQGEHE